MEALPLPPSVSLPVARATLQGDLTRPQLIGEALFSPYGRGTLVIVRLIGLTESGFLGLHIHENGNCSSGGDVPFAQAGQHYDPHGVTHPWHAGDLPPILALADGTALSAVYTDRFRPNDVIGRSIVLHGMPDDLHSQPAGNSGMRIACGVIQSL